MKNKSIYFVLIAYSILASIALFWFNGSGDDGDSVFHYQFAKYAPVHPQLFFNHWAKPVFVLLACPFAQFGFMGIKVFNLIVSLLTIFITYKIIQKLNIKNASVGTLLLIGSPLFFILTFSGLTEPLFSLFVCIGIHAVLNNKNVSACVVLSFLPFVRSEGLIIIGVFCLYFMLKGNWKILPVLTFGSLVYSIAGYFVYDDFLWVFTKIPYASLSSIYGSGELSHFVIQLLYVVGIPVYILFWIGLICLIWKSIKRNITLELQVLILLGFLSFFIAHSLFWYLGIFNSMGLKRVLLGVAPLISIIALVGFNFITEELVKDKKIIQQISKGLVIGSVLLFPFTTNKAAINWDRDLKLTISQRCAIQAANYITKNIGINHRFVYAHSYLSEVLNIDHFDLSKRIELTPDFLNEAKSGDIVVWENWFAVVQYGITKEQLDSNSELIHIIDLSVQDNKHESLYSIYEHK